MDNIIHTPSCGNPDTKPRSDALLALDKAEESAALNFKHCWIAAEKTGAMSDQLKLFGARTAWDNRWRQIQRYRWASDTAHR